ncbi:MAG TPA: hypothetical protein VFD91_04210 [Mariniphaga sp.]|nr:hypothetical protein [Mariniphaga sp.]
MRIKVILLFIFLLSISLSAQERKYFDTPFGGGGAYTPGWYFPNLDALNNELANLNIPKLSESGFYSSGGAGFIYIGFIDYLRLGGMGFGGSTSEVSPSDANGFTKEVVFSLSGGGLTAEYSLPFIRDIAVSPGFIFGAGSIQIDIYNNKGAFNWNNVWNELNNITGESVRHTLTNSFFFFAPTLNVDIPLYRFISFRIGAGYQFTFGDDWEIDNNQQLNNVPSDINGNSFFLQSGIFIGFFSF